MSHMNTFQTAMNSLSCLKDACKALNLTFKEDQKTARFYAGKLADCDHAIGLPNTTYEVGIVKQPDHSYAVMADYFDPNVEKAIGKNGSKLVVQHNVAKAVQEVRASGMGTILSMTPLENGGLQIKIRGN